MNILIEVFVDHLRCKFRSNPGEFIAAILVSATAFNSRADRKPHENEPPLLHSSLVPTFMSRDTPIPTLLRLLMTSSNNLCWVKAFNVETHSRRASLFATNCIRQRLLRNPDPRDNLETWQEIFAEDEPNKTFKNNMLQSLRTSRYMTTSITTLILNNTVPEMSEIIRLCTRLERLTVYVEEVASEFDDSTDRCQLGSLPPLTLSLDAQHTIREVQIKYPNDTARTPVLKEARSKQNKIETMNYVLPPVEYRRIEKLVWRRPYSPCDPLQLLPLLRFLKHLEIVGEFLSSTTISEESLTCLFHSQLKCLRHLTVEDSVMRLGPLCPASLWLDALFVRETGEHSLGLAKLFLESWPELKTLAIFNYKDWKEEEQQNDEIEKQDEEQEQNETLQVEYKNQFPKLEELVIDASIENMEYLNYFRFSKKLQSIYIRNLHVNIFGQEFFEYLLHGPEYYSSETEPKTEIPVKEVVIEMFDLCFLVDWQFVQPDSYDMLCFETITPLPSTVVRFEANDNNNSTIWWRRAPSPSDKFGEMANPLALAASTVILRLLENCRNNIVHFSYRHWEVTPWLVDEFCQYCPNIQRLEFSFDAVAQMGFPISKQMIELSNSLPSPLNGICSLKHLAVLIIDCINVLRNEENANDFSKVLEKHSETNNRTIEVHFQHWASILSKASGVESGKDNFLPLNTPGSYRRDVHPKKQSKESGARRERE